MEETAAIMGGSFQIRSFDKGNNVSYEIWPSCQFKNHSTIFIDA